MTEKELMLMSILKCQRIDLYKKSIVLTPPQEKCFQEMQKRYKDGEPLQYILGETEFMGLLLKVNSKVLIPRPETELLVDALLKEIKEFSQKTLRILDIGTGSGNISISLAKYISACEVISVDISHAALKVAKTNAQINQVEKKVKFLQKDYLEYLNTSFHERTFFDMIVSNPPYILSTQMTNLPIDVQQEPKVALDGGPQGLDFYGPIISLGFQILNKGGVLAFEFGEEQKESICTLLQDQPDDKIIKFYKDDHQQDRFVIIQKK